MSELSRQSAPGASYRGALDDLMDLAAERGATVTWGRKGKLYTVTLEGPDYRETGIGETRDGAATALVDIAFDAHPEKRRG